MKTLTSMKTLALLAGMLCLAGHAQAEDDKATTVTIPATGHLAFLPERNFTGPAGVTVSNFYGSGSATSTGLRFNNQELGEGVVIGHTAGSTTPVILTAQPGTYTITFTDQTATKQFFSTSVYWTEEPVATTTKAGTRIYKFVNEVGHVGFERDEQYAATDYMSCGMGDGEHCYTQLTENPLKRITATLETTIEELSFIPWSELWDCPMVDTSGIGIALTEDTANNAAVYTLSGQRVSQPQKGLYIKNGKKYIAH